MRLEAGAISASEPGRRLPLPSSRDEIRRLGETLNEMLDRLDTVLERERNFVADASHELRTPLTLLGIELELASTAPALGSESSRRRSVRPRTKLPGRTRLADDLLLLAATDRSGLPLRREADRDTRAPRPDRRTLHRTRARLRANGHRRRAGDAHGRRAIPCPSEQALGNLIENALRHGHGPVRLTARRARRRGRAPRPRRRRRVSARVPPARVRPLQPRRQEPGATDGRRHRIGAHDRCSDRVGPRRLDPRGELRRWGSRRLALAPGVSYAPTWTKTIRGAELDDLAWRSQRESTLPSIDSNFSAVPDANIATWFLSPLKLEPSQSKPRGRPAWGRG